MTEPIPSRSELFLRLTRLSTLILLLLILLLGLMCLAMALRPDGAVSRFLEHASWVIPVGFVLIVTVLGITRRKYRFTPDSAEVKAVMNDELRRTSLDRARFVAFSIVLIAQVPIALLLSDQPAFRAVMAMAVSTITIGMVVLIASFLFFDRG